MLSAAISAGMMFQRDSRFGLYQARRSTVIGGTAAHAPGCRRRRSRRHAPRQRPRWSNCGRRESSAAARSGRPRAAPRSPAGMLSTSSTSPRSMTSAISGAERSVAIALEHARSVEPRSEPRRSFAAALIEHRVGRMREVVGRAIAEQQRLQQRRARMIIARLAGSLTSASSSLRHRNAIRCEEVQHGPHALRSAACAASCATPQISTTA